MRGGEWGRRLTVTPSREAGELASPRGRSATVRIPRRHWTLLPRLRNPPGRGRGLGSSSPARSGPGAHVRVFELCFRFTEPKTRTAKMPSAPVQKYVPGCRRGWLGGHDKYCAGKFSGRVQMSILIVASFQDSCLCWETQSPSAGSRSRHRRSGTRQGGVGAH
jgi:hypothetical protein